VGRADRRLGNRDDNISGFASTGFLTRTGAGAYSFQSLTNGISLGNIAQSAANTVIGNATGSTANNTALPVPNCSGAANGLIWTAASGFGCNTYGSGAGSPGSLTLLETHTASTSAELDFTSWYSSSYSVYVIEFISLLPATNATDINLEVSTNGGSSYDTTAGHYEYGMLRWLYNNGPFASGSLTGLANLPITGAFAATPNTASTGGVSGSAKLYSPGSSTASKRLHWEVGYLPTTTGGSSVEFTATGTYNQTTAVNAFRVRAASGNLTSGAVKVYGVSN
jgi:hypothetical protein